MLGSVTNSGSGRAAWCYPLGEVQEGEPAMAWRWVPDDDPMNNEPAIWASVRGYPAGGAFVDSGAKRYTA